MDFAGRGFWQFSDKVDPAWIFVRGEAALAEFHQFADKRRISRLSFLEDDEGLRLDKTFLIEPTNNGRLDDVGCSISLDSISNGEHQMPQTFSMSSLRPL